MRDALRSIVLHFWPPQDPRAYQIVTLAGLFGYGVIWLDFAVSGVQTLVILATVLLTQALCSRLWQLPTYDPRSALISGLSLCLLLRTNTVSLAVLTAIITIVSKFVLRWRGKHIFNPTNFGLVAMMLGTGQAWVSSGQWGYVQFVWYWGNALLWSLAGVTLTVPLLDWLLPGRRYAWPQAGAVLTRAECAHVPISSPGGRGLG